MDLLKKHQELKTVHEALVQAGKLSALGELSAGVAHELNQPLQGIKGYSQMLLDTPYEEKTYTEFLGEIVKNSDRMAAIIRDLRSFTQASIEGFDWIDVAEPIRGAHQMVQGHLKASGVKFSLQVEKGLPKVFANRNQLEQVFVNLFNNAKDAVAEMQSADGALNVEIKQTLDNEITIIVQDNGIGMDSETREKVFNPFFTTKTAGRGMGLGLSVSYSIFQKHRGIIQVKSQKGKGSTFTLKLPIDFRKKKGPASS